MAKSEKKHLLISQEIKLAKILAGNNKKLRDRTLKRLSKWLCDRTASRLYSEDVFMRIWKGLFYSMWMSDKPLIQEECAEKISKLIHLGNVKASLIFFKCFLQTMINEWFGIDFHRLDKFLMLVRRLLRQAFIVLKSDSWNLKHVRAFRNILNMTALKGDNTSSLGLTFHIDEIFLEELAKVSCGKLKEEILLELLQPFAQQIACVHDNRQINHVNTYIFKQLMHQSDVGIDYKEKFHAWRMSGFPGGTIDAMEKVIIEKTDQDNNEDDGAIFNGPKDPRAGKVDVILPQLKFDVIALTKMLDEIRFKPYATVKGRKTLTKLIEQFQNLNDEIFPLGPTKVATVKDVNYSTLIQSSVKSLQEFEETLRDDSDKSSRKQKKIQEILDEMLKKRKRQAKQKQSILYNSPSSSYEDFINKSEEGLLGSNITANEKKRKRSSEDKEMSTKKPPIKKKVKSVNNTSMNGDAITTKKQKQCIRNSGTWQVDEIVPKAIEKSSKTTKSTKNKTVRDEWEKPLQDGETEFFVVSNKSKKKLKRLTEKTNQPISEIVTKLSDTIMNGNSSTRKEKPSTTMVKNPFSLETPVRQKKIKFALNLNKSQEFQEHQTQLYNSPDIPYDASRKPLKPLLKPSPITSPINPFYKKKSDFTH